MATTWNVTTSVGSMESHYHWVVYREKSKALDVLPGGGPVVHRP